MRYFLKITLITACFALLGSPSLRAQPSARIECAAEENGQAGSGSMRVMSGEKEIAKVSCGRPADVPAGSYDVTVSLDGAVDGPQHRERVEARAGQTARVRASFETGELIVDVTRAGRRGIGIVRVLRGSAPVATLTAGVASRLSTGTYTVSVESRSDKRVFDAVTIARGQRRALIADFDANGSQASQ